MFIKWALPYLVVVVAVLVMMERLVFAHKVVVAVDLPLALLMSYPVKL
jgi:hypothetical protein